MTRALDILLQHAEQARDRAQSDWQAAQARLRALQQQAQQLLGYQQETRDRDPARDGRPTGIDALMVHRSFMQRLQQAVDLQKAQLDHVQLQAQALQAELMARELRVAQVQKLQARRTQETLRHQGRQEQRQSDDAGQQRLHLARAEAAQVTEPAPLAPAVGAAPHTPSLPTGLARLVPRTTAPTPAALP